MKVDFYLGLYQDRGAFIHAARHFHHVLPLAIRISGHVGCILEIQLPMAHGRRARKLLLQVGQPVADAFGLLQDVGTQQRSRGWELIQEPSAYLPDEDLTRPEMGSDEK